MIKKGLALLVIIAVYTLLGCGGKSVEVTPAKNEQAPQKSESEWDAIVAKAKKEGQVVVAGAPLGSEYSKEMQQAFEKRFGFKMQYIGANGNDIDTRVIMEGKAKQATIDVALSGTNPLRTLIPEGVVEPLAPLILMPEVKDTANWQDNKLHWTDDEKKYLLQTVEGVMTDLFVNPNVVKPDEIKTWNDLLDPKYQGKIASHDPRGAGAGQATASYLLLEMGEKFMVDLYKGQKVVISNNHNQIAEWVARGTYPIVIGANAPQIETFRKQGLNIVRVFPTDAPGSLVGSQGFINLVKDRPHTNAGIVFANWFASKEAQAIHEKYNKWPSMRKDVKSADTPEYLIPKEGLKYSNSSTSEFVIKTRPAATTKIIELLGK